VAPTLRVLLAEDHAINRMAVQFILEALPVDLVSVEDGALAVEAFSAQAFDVVLMDMQMPVKDGLTAIREIRRLEGERGGTHIPICVLTAHAAGEHRDAACAAGADAFLTKPIEASALLSYVAGASALYAAE